MRVDRLETLALEADKRASQGPFVAAPALAQAIGLKVEELPGALRAIGFRPGAPAPAPAPADAPADAAAAGVELWQRAKPGRRKPGPVAPRRPVVAADSPFAKLRGLKVAR